MTAPTAGATAGSASKIAIAPGKGVPGSTKLTAGTEQPHYLYTLTPAGEQHRKFLLALAENDAGHAESHYDLA
jgi:hypothetical protein